MDAYYTMPGAPSSVRMEIGRWGSKTIRLGQCPCEGMEYCRRSTLKSGGNKRSLWRVLWMKMKREKRKMFEHYPTQASSSGKFPYDPCSYSQNFDQGNPADELDNLSRSFSARFALADAASRIFLDKTT